MEELEYKLADGSLFYCRQGQACVITRYQGLAGTVTVPALLPAKRENESESVPVKEIAKKAFLSKKYLRSVTLPDTIEEVGDWAFAYCDALQEVSFSGRQIRFGKAVFMECPVLRCIRFPSLEDDKDARMTWNSANINCDGAGALLAAAVTQMDSPYLLNAQEVGSKEWLDKWDARMLTILHAPDSEGYSKQILCGEEDYESTDYETYLENSRKKKVRLALLRLLYPIGLGDMQEAELKEYLLAHTMGGASHETWDVVHREYGDRREFYELFATLGCLTRENAPSIIATISEEYPEMKAYFLKYQADHFDANDFFGGLEL